MRTQRDERRPALFDGRREEGLLMKVLAIFIGLSLTAIAAWGADGAAIYASKCKVCHSIGGVAGPMAQMGGPLDGVGSKHNEEWIRAYLKDPKSQIPNAKMKPVNLPEADFEAIVQYLMSLK
jgi:nitric oxide reductase subunit C